MQSEQSKLVGKTKCFKVASHGPIIKEVTFVPKSTKKKAELEERTKQEAGKNQSGRN